MDVAEAEEAARGIEDAKKQVGPPDTSAPSGADAPKEAPADQQAAGDSSGSKAKQQETQALSVASGGDTRKGVTPPLPRAAGDSTGSSEATAKTTTSFKGANELSPEKSGVPTPTSATAASKRPHPQASNDGAEATAPGVDEPAAKTAQGRQPSLRPRPNVTADKRAGNVEPVGQVPTVPPDGTAGNGAV
ncbi:mediator of RNA polymerase II transcription subunit 1-like [Rhipicephalus sanguineus]|uniref:mediator of RNA polymerase II transcription subunit 1-like n=1 Tax=Rhipicephalus sanguineus TaxID=34632 RepID=UPI001895408D|nr:mediator of RNA polymerase II transcription subunit 1-like [Rhipicephalus sanguineus]